MEPTNTIVDMPNNPSCCQKTKKCLMYTPVGCLGLASIGGIGIAFANGFSGAISLTNLTVTNIALANIAFGGTIAIGAVVIGGFIVYIMPKKLFEENIEDQREATIELQSTVKDIDHTIVDFHDENVNLKNTLNETETNFNNLKIELDDKLKQLVLMSEILKSTLNQLKAIKDDFSNAQKTICDAKEIILSMMDMSKKIKLNIKSSKIALNLFKDYNQDLEVEIKDLNIENRELSSLLQDYTKIINEEHNQFTLLIKASEILNDTCDSLKKELDEFASDGKKLTEDVEKDSQTALKLEFLQKQLENLSDKLKDV